MLCKCYMVILKIYFLLSTDQLGERDHIDNELTEDERKVV